MTEFWQLTFPMPGQSENTARRVEQAGWDGLYFADTQCLSGDIYSAMCLAAKATTHLKIGTAVTNPVTRHPAVTASAIATVQVESAGRAVLGIGRGDSSLGYLGQKPASATTLRPVRSWPRTLCANWPLARTSFSLTSARQSYVASKTP